MLSYTRYRSAFAVRGVAKGASFYSLLPFLFMFDPMSDLQGPHGSDDSAPVASVRVPQQGGRQFADDVHSITIHARQRTFYVDLKQSSNGKFFKISEKSRGGQKTTIMFDVEDLDQFIQAFQEMKSHV